MIILTRVIDENVYLNFTFNSDYRLKAEDFKVYDSA